MKDILQMIFFFLNARFFQQMFESFKTRTKDLLVKLHELVTC